MSGKVNRANIWNKLVSNTVYFNTLFSKQLTNVNGCGGTMDIDDDEIIPASPEVQKRKRRSFSRREKRNKLLSLKKCTSDGALSGRSCDGEAIQASAAANEFGCSASACGTQNTD